jgi:hypothetical protein
VEEEHHPDLTRRVALQGVLDGDKVFEGFGHFGAVNVEVARVEEIVDPLVAAEAGLLVAGSLSVAVAGQKGRKQH